MQHCAVENSASCTQGGTSSAQPWFAVWVRSRYEKTVADYLQAGGYQPFLPTYSERRQWSDRVRVVEMPLFAGYLFCRFDPFDRLPILKAPGAIQIVGVGRQPIPVEETEIAALQRLVRSGLPRQPWPYLKAGQRVRIESGSISGVEGILISFRGQQRIIVSVSLLQRSVSLEIERSWVKPVPEAKQPPTVTEYSLLKPIIA